MVENLVGDAGFGDCSAVYWDIGLMAATGVKNWDFGYKLGRKK